MLSVQQDELKTQTEIQMIARICVAQTPRTPLSTAKERKAVDIHIHMKGDIFRVMFGVTFGMLTANLRIGDTLLIIWIVVDVLVHWHYLI